MDSLSQPDPARPATISDQGARQQDLSELRAGLEKWSHQMDLYTGPDALLDFNQVDYVHIDVTDSNPSGLAQLMMGRKTRLSTILRDKAKLEGGMVAARALRSKIFELQSEHGLDAGFFVAGTASWLSRDIQQDGMAAEKRFIAPILMAPLEITPHPNSNDFELRLTGQAKLNPALVRQLRKEYGLDLRQLDVGQLANSMSKLDPEPVIERMRAETSRIPGMMIESKHLVSTFSDLKVSPGELPEEAYTPLLGDIAHLMFLGETEKLIPPVIRHSLPALDERAPEDEMLVADADAASQEVIDLAASDHSFVVAAAPGTRPLDTALNIATTLISQGKSVLVVGEKSSTLSSFKTLLAQHTLQELVFDLLRDQEPEQIRTSLVQSIIRNEQASAPNTDQQYQELREIRDALADHTSSLKYTESRWGCSVYDALQTLAALTEQDPAPSTTVRFNHSTMDALIERQEVGQKLVRLAELAAFKPSTLYSAWTQAKITNTKECNDVYALVGSLRQSLTVFQQKMRQLAQYTGLREGASMLEWNAQISLLERMRQTLVKFRADVYDRPVTDLIAATATGAWRREHGVEMSSIQRSRLRKAAKEYIRPGVHLHDLHENLQIVQTEREEWITWAAEPKEPLIPENLNELRAALTNLDAEFSGLAIVLEDSPAGHEFTQTPIVDVAQRLQDLLDDEKNLQSLPERDRLQRELYQIGLEDFMVDMLRHQIAPENIVAELELAWWQSALEHMLESESLKILDGETLRALETQFRVLDAAHHEATPARLAAKLADLWRSRIAAGSHGAAYLRSQLTGHDFDIAQLLAHAPQLVTALFPLWISSPFALNRKISQTVQFDTVILLDSESTPLAANLPAITRAHQVIAFGDPHSGFPAPFMVSAISQGTPLDTDSKIVSTFDALERLLATRHLATVEHAEDPSVFGYINETFYDGALARYPWGDDYTQQAQAFTVEYLDTSGKVSDNANPDSPSFEVQRVAERVFEHAYKNPGQSLAVVTPSQRHAQRVAEAVRTMLPNYPQLAGFFAPGQEPFRVVDLSRASGIERDVIIFSLGIGKTHHGVAVHTIGQLSAQHGRKRLILALSRARHLTKVISCVRADDLNLKHLQNGAVDLYKILKKHEQYLTDQANQQAFEPITHKIPTNEFLKNANIEAIDMGDWLLNDLVHRLADAPMAIKEPTTSGMSLILVSETESLVAGARLSPRERKSGRGRGSALRFPLAVWSDGDDRYCQLSVRERTRLIPNRLARTGWNHMTLWTMEVFSDPQKVIDRMYLYLGIETESPGT